MSEFELKALAAGLALPAAATFLIVVLTHPLTANRPRAAFAIGTCMFAGVYFASYYWLAVAPIKPVNSEHYIIYAALLALIAGALLAAFAAPDCLTWRIRLAVAVVCAIYVVPNWEDLVATRPWWILALAGVVFESWNLLDIQAKRIPGAAPPLVLAVVMLAGAFVLFQSGSAKFAQLLAIASAILFGLACAQFRKIDPGVLRGMVPGVAVMIPAWMLTGKLYTFSNVPNWSFVLIAAAPAVMSLALIPLPKSISPRLQRWLAAIVALGMAAIAVVLTLTSEGGDAEW